MKQNGFDKKHLTSSQRLLIEKGLNDGCSFADIARNIHKHPSTISKEVRKYRVFQEPKRNLTAKKCASYRNCTIRFLCQNKDCVKVCKTCHDYDAHSDRCPTLCPRFQLAGCSQLQHFPYVCNSCPKRRNCKHRHAFYNAQQADEESHALLVSCRNGINQQASSIAVLDALISPLLKKGQSLAHIYASHGHEIACCRKTLYKYLDLGVFTAGNLDLRRRVRYRCKPRRTATRVSLAAREYRIGRTYEDFEKQMKQFPDIPVVEMDTVEGCKGSQKALLTLFFRNCSLMLIFLLPEKTSAAVTAVFNMLYKGLGHSVFTSLFPLILTDNGTEFQCPEQLEKDWQGTQRTHLYYCTPNCSWQKGRIERNHAFIRYVIPKGLSMDNYTPENILLLMNHINNEARDSLNGQTPYKLSLLLLNTRLHHLLTLRNIPPDEVFLKPALLTR